MTIKLEKKSSSSVNESTINSIAEVENANVSKSTALSANSSYQIPVLCYHTIVTTTTGTYQTGLTSFKEQMAYLYSNNYTTLSLEQFRKIINSETTVPSKPILLTFDDCYSDFYSVVYPILKKYGMKATQFVVSNWIGGSGRMTKSQINEIAQNNIDVQNHTDNHSYLTQQTYAQQYAAINNAAVAIKSLTGKSVTALAYPYGAYDNNSLEALAKLSYTMGFTVSSGLCTSSNTKYKLPRICMIDTDTLTTFKRKITNGY
ncbi:MAG: xylanase/chitin deacetylase family protein [Firmicutes bacterium]|nr:xylanase/chitin deacetylase family protein [Bacillota bacterium]